MLVQIMSLAFIWHTKHCLAAAVSVSLHMPKCFVSSLAGTGFNRQKNALQPGTSRRLVYLIGNLS